MRGGVGVVKGGEGRLELGSGVGWRVHGRVVDDERFYSVVGRLAAVSTNF